MEGEKPDQSNDLGATYVVTDPRYEHSFSYKAVTPWIAARMHLKSLYIDGDIQTRALMTESTVISVQKVGVEEVLKYQIKVQLNEAFDVDVAKEGGEKDE